MSRVLKKPKHILSLKPTQFAVGMLEVDEKLEVVRNYSKKHLQKFVRATPVPVVRAPNGQLYVVDRHHFLCVCYHAGVMEVFVEITKDFKGTKIKYRDFWKWMAKSRNAYLFCQFGEGPHREFYLPKDVRGLADDPYRSMAWFVRKSGAFENSDKNFAEFQWANFFRKKQLLNRDGMAGFSKALIKAVNLAQSPAAKKLPGYGKLNLLEKSKAETKIVKNVKKYRKRFAERAVVADKSPQK
jgi:hypothetical protein